MIEGIRVTVESGREILEPKAHWGVRVLIQGVPLQFQLRSHRDNHPN
jgi:hypothetical protein